MSHNRLVDLSVEVSTETIGPPSTSVPVKLERFHRGPGFWQVSSIHASVHTGTHIDTPLHCYADGKTTSDVSLHDLSGKAAYFGLDKQPSAPVTADDLGAADPGLAEGEMAVLATGWTDAMWGRFPDYYVNSPFLHESAARWLARRRPAAVVFDFFEEECARRKDFTSEEFVVHRILLGAGIYLVEHATGLAQLRGRQAQVYAAFYRIADCDGAPARLFALVEQD
ncbi:MAG TPA: cyclase family protein [Streptosporangiaceae bacterium]|jgi:kynurenine formamidase